MNKLIIDALSQIGCIICDGVPECPHNCRVVPVYKRGRENAIGYVHGDCMANRQNDFVSHREMWSDKIKVYLTR